MVRRLLHITLILSVFFAVAAYSIADEHPHICPNSEIWQYSCEDPGPCLNACGWFCKSQTSCAECCAQFRTNVDYSICMSYCGLTAVTPADYLAD